MIGLWVSFSFSECVEYFQIKIRVSAICGFCGAVCSVYPRRYGFVYFQKAKETCPNSLFCTFGHAICK